MADLATRIKELKNLRRMTSQELSALSGVPLGTLNKVLSSSTKSVKTETLKKIADALSVSVSVLLGEKRERPKKSGANYGFLKVASVTPSLKLGSVLENVSEIKNRISYCAHQRASLITFPELSLCGKTVGDLLFNELLLEKCEKSLVDIADFSRDYDSLIFVGAPLRHNGALYNTAVAILRGDILGVIAKDCLSDLGDDKESRYFAKAQNKNREITICGRSYPFGKKLLFKDRDCPLFKIGAIIGSGADSLAPLSMMHAKSGATVLVNLSSQYETAGASRQRREWVKSLSKMLNLAVVVSSAGKGESGTDFVYAGHNLIAENGKLLTETNIFTENCAITEIDLELINKSRITGGEIDECLTDGYDEIEFSLPLQECELTREYSRSPFIPEDENLRNEYIEEILNIQAEGLIRRLKHINCKKTVIGLSGGLDSTLAILATCRAYDKMLYSRRDIIAVTMPCFGTSERTKSNSVDLADCLGVTLKEIDITKSVRQHFEDIGHDEKNTDVTYENAQARERTQVIMDVANEVGGIVVGTGDLSELALGWATYNGDHMSMFSINGSIPKTLIRHIVAHEAKNGSSELNRILSDILETPVSPELLPPSGEEIKQKTEDIVGPYELHDFFIYHFVKNCFSPSKIYLIALKTFDGVYEKEVIYKWLESFIKRFFAQQFKRSCLPDGVSVGEISFSPRGSWVMPSDAMRSLWIDDLAKVKK